MEPSVEGRNINAGYYVVSLLDIQGQSEKMLRLEPLPEGEEGRQHTLNLLVESAGFVCKLRTLMKETYDQRAVVPQEMRKSSFAKKLAASSIKSESFSDTVVSFASLRNTDENEFPIVGLYGMLGATAGAMMAALNGGHALRGGIDVGIGTDFIENEIYGPALLKAYKLESCTAKPFPRIAVGPMIERFLSEMSALPNDTSESKFTAGLAMRCQRLITTDTDGVRILDYAGSEMVSIGGAPAKEFVLGAHRFVKRELERFGREGNQKLVQKYDYLNKYLESRIRPWA